MTVAYLCIDGSTEENEVVNWQARIVSVDSVILGLSPVHGIDESMRSSGIRRLMNVFTLGRHNKYQSGYMKLDQSSDTIFSSQLLTTWRQLESKLWDIIDKHQRLAKKIKNAQKNCLKSSEKVKKYKAVLYDRKSPLAYKCSNSMMQYDYRNAKAVAAKLDKKQKHHDKEFRDYNALVWKEMDLRVKIAKIAAMLEGEILDKLQSAVYNMMEGRGLTVSPDDITRVSRHVIRMACSEYRYMIPSGDPCHSRPIQSPTRTSGPYNKKSVKDVLATFIMTGCTVYMI